MSDMEAHLLRELEEVRHHAGHCRAVGADESAELFDQAAADISQQLDRLQQALADGEREVAA